MKTAFSIMAASVVLASALAAQDSSPKGIYRDPASTPTTNGVAYRVVLLRGEETQQPVPVSFAFRSGDRFKLQLKLKDAAYVYILNRTFDGDTKDLVQTRGIERVREEDHKHRDHSHDTFTLLYPGVGQNPDKVSAGSYLDVPNDATLRMDKHPGLEKLYVIVSDTPLDLPKLFPDGTLRVSSDRSKGVDPKDDVLDKLDKDLADWASGTQSDGPKESESKGIVRDPDTVTVGARNKPILAEITMRHYAN